MAKPVAESNGNQKMVPADCVSVLLMAIGNTSISKAQYEMMSALDGNRTASSFEHQFRSITSKAKELKKRVEDGEDFVPVPPTNKRGTTATPATPRKRKTAEADGTPTKKRTPSKKKASESPTNELDGGDDLPADMDEFIKQEKVWEGSDYV